MSRLLHRLAAVAAGTALAVAGPFASGAHADTPAAANLATNPGFEIPALPLDDWGAIPGWQCTVGEAAVTGTARSGASALTVTPAGEGSTGRCEQTLSVRPGTTYTVSAWVRGAYVFLGAEGTGHDAAPAWTPDTGGEWRQLTTSFTTGTATTAVRLYLHGWYGQGAYAVDDVRVDGPAPAPARALWNVPTTDPVVFVTVDDGWQRTPEAAALVAERRVPVTAFPLPMPLGFDPEWFRKVTAGPGSSVQIHSVSHRDLTTLSPEEQQAEICGARDAVLRRTGTTPTVFRPPYLAWNADTLQAAANCGITTVMTATADFSWGASNVYHGGPLRPGDVVLLHFTDTLASDLARVLDAADAAGLRPAGLAEYLS